MAINVKSEIGVLKKVMLHRPGKELENLVPATLERLLFDDIPYLYAAQEEHDEFAKILRENGVEVLYLEDLAAETIKQSTGLKENFISDVINSAGLTAQKYKNELFEYLNSFKDEKELVLKTMEGVDFADLDIKNSTKNNPLSGLLNIERRFVMDPIPNLYFTRDPFACIGGGVSLNKMYSITRNRETIYGKYVLKYHPDYAEKVPFYYDRENDYHIEGGDILNLNNHVLAVGISQRTQPEAIEELARNIFNDESSEIDTVLAVDIPPIRAFMHLDTVFTQIDYDKFTVHPGIMRTLRVFELTKGDTPDELKCKEYDDIPFDRILAKYLGVDKVTLIQCGGGDAIAAEREQWNDGSNTLCIAPGKVVVYNRNYVTNGVLEQSGIKLLKMPSAELSRGRGGPRCMSMPFWREDLK